MEPTSPGRHYPRRRNPAPGQDKQSEGTDAQRKRGGPLCGKPLDSTIARDVQPREDVGYFVRRKSRGANQITERDSARPFPFARRITPGESCGGSGTKRILARV